MTPEEQAAVARALANRQAVMRDALGPYFAEFRTITNRCEPLTPEEERERLPFEPGTVAVDRMTLGTLLRLVANTHRSVIEGHPMAHVQTQLEMASDYSRRLLWLLDQAER